MARERREFFMGPGCGRGGVGGRGAHLGAEVALREEDEDRLRALDVLLERPDVFKVIDIDEDFDAGQQQHQLLLDDCDGVLTGGPIERGEGLVRNTTLLQHGSES